MQNKYYIQNTRDYVGNSILLFRPEGKGYTTNLEEAGLFTKKEVEMITSNNNSLEAWKSEYLLLKSTRMVDAQNIKKLEGSIFKESGE